jgi:hypothetical protein
MILATVHRSPFSMIRNEIGNPLNVSCTQRHNRFLTLRCET